MAFIKRLIARFKYGTCPNCGTAIHYSAAEAVVPCPKCHKRLVISGGEIVGTR